MAAWLLRPLPRVARLPAARHSFSRCLAACARSAWPVQFGKQPGSMIF